MTASLPRLDRLFDPVPHSRVLSNGRYTVLLTGAGTGWSAWDGLGLTAWSGDRTEDRDGLFVYLRDRDRGTVWSAGHQPVGRAAERYAVDYEPGVLRIARVDDEIATSVGVCVAPDADVELRRIRLRNLGRGPRRIEVTTWVEVVLADPAAHAAHPAFSKLFVQTEWAEGAEALLARRRPRSAADPSPWMVHALLGVGAAEFDTDRARVLGRGGSRVRPAALVSPAPLAATVGSVLDPVLCLRRTVELRAGAEEELILLLGAAATRESVLALVGPYRAPAAGAAAFAGATASERALLGRVGLSEADAELLQESAGAALSGLPGAGGGAARDAATAGAYWTAKRIPVAWMAPERLQALAAAVAAPAPEPPPRRFRPALELPDLAPRVALPRNELLRFDDGYGGFALDGTEYVMRLDPGAPVALRRPPMPWGNVIANETVGCLVSEGGAGHTWSRNSREHRLTPWSNDPVADPYGEALWIRDEQAGVFWSPLPGPTPPDAAVEVRHGFGYSRWRHTSRELVQEVCVFVPPVDPVRVVQLRLTNAGAGERRLSAFSYARLVLGVLPSAGAIVTERSADVLLARNPTGDEFADGVTFAAAVPPAGAGPITCTADRTGFLGRNGSPADPAAVRGAVALDGRTGAGLDPCAALQVPLTLRPGETVECAFLLGETIGADAALALVARYRASGAVARALDDTRAAWRHTLGAVQVETPSPAIDLMLNGWLGYQNLSCRIRGRAAFFQSGGAFGFRDQLQDAAALVYARPDLTRAQILLHAAHQFVDGDVLHWWHPPAGRGTRTRFSDDLLWLPYVTAFYVRTTGDWGVLDESVGFVTARALESGEDETYLLPARASETADVYAHCCRALDRALTVGAHGLPLMGTGDWNDGMNRVGREGRGESVWLGFFLYRILGDVLPLCARRRDRARIRRYRAHRTRLRRALEHAGWDGAWYRRAYYDDGTPLGTARDRECRIDAIAQAWAVLSGAAPRARAERAMDAVERELVDADAGIVRLLAPPFDRTPHDPGYIKGYVPGIRENGGQYTHAALWVVRALAELGRRDRAAAVLEMLTPVHHARTRAGVATYQVEPYVVAADVYGVAPHRGRGGWTWYTGSAGWMYRVALESVLGLTLEGGRTLRIAPCIPDDWPGFRVEYRLVDGRTRYVIGVENPHRCTAGVVGASVDGRAVPVQGGAARISLRADGGVHVVRVTLGAGPAPALSARRAGGVPRAR
ncbi:MAG: glycosyl transferase [Candidatus Binatia bacterium]